MDNKTDHWNTIYSTKKHESVSWYQQSPITSLELIEKYCPNKKATIIDVGGGQSLLTDHLLKRGYYNITVLDISEKAIEKARQRLGKLADKVHWIVSDIVKFNSDEKFDFWLDRATFHFLDPNDEVAKYKEVLRNTVKENGIVTIGTFSTDGPTKCSGIDITQYDEDSLPGTFDFLEKIACFRSDHKTPSNTNQNFIFCSFRKI